MNCCQVHVQKSRIYSYSYVCEWKAYFENEKIKLMSVRVYKSFVYKVKQKGKNVKHTKHCLIVRTFKFKRNRNYDIINAIKHKILTDLVTVIYHFFLSLKNFHTRTPGAFRTFAYWHYAHVRDCNYILHLSTFLCVPNISKIFCNFASSLEIPKFLKCFAHSRQIPKILYSVSIPHEFKLYEYSVVLCVLTSML